MSKIVVSEELLKKVASNARLELSQDEIRRFLPQFEEILKAFEKIDSVDVRGIKPAFQPVPLANRFREDNVEPGLSNAQALQNAVHQKPPFFKGPKAIE